MADALKQLPDLIALRAPISNGALKADRLPTRIKIFNWGVNPSTQGDWTVGNKSAALLAANQKALGFERVALDFGHCTVAGSPEYVKGKTPEIFGYGRPAIIPNDGAWIEDIAWTPLGIEKARNFEDLSPCVAAKSGEVDFIHSVALLPNGSLEGVTFFSATAQTQNKPIEQTNAPMTEETILVADLAPSLGLPATAKKPELLAKLALLSALMPLTVLVKDGSLLTSDLCPLTSDLEKRLKTVETAAGSAGIPAGVVALSARLETLEASLAAAATQNNETARDQVLVLLSAEGKAPLDPATRKPFAPEALRKMDVTTLRILHANTPATVPLSARTRTATDGNGLDPNLKGRAKMEAAFNRDNANASRS